MSSSPGVLRVFFRSCGSENTKDRPFYYDKRRALMSLLRAAAAVDQPVELVFCNDGPIPAGRLAIMAEHGEVVAVSGGSNRRSYRAVVARAAAGAHDDDLIWFAEDDYLYRPHALVALMAGARALPRADYFALTGSESLDPRASRTRTDPRPEPGAQGDPHAVVVDGVAWFRARAVASTFGVRGRVLREDARLLRFAPWTGGAWDTATCLAYQGFAPFRPAEIRDRSRVRRRPGAHPGGGPPRALRSRAMPGVAPPDARGD